MGGGTVEKRLTSSASLSCSLLPFRAVWFRVTELARKTNVHVLSDKTATLFKWFKCCVRDTWISLSWRF